MPFPPDHVPPHRPGPASSDDPEGGSSAESVAKPSAQGSLERPQNLEDRRTVQGQLTNATVPGAFPEVSDLELHGFVGAGTTLVGTYSFSGTVRIDGSVEGDIRGGHRVIIGQSARVRGTVTADVVLVLGGEVDAEIRGREYVELRVPAIVSGRVQSPQIKMDQGLQFSGICEMKAV